MLFTLSIVIPLYNKSPYISHTLDSVLAQTFRSFEIVIINDGSTDNSAEIVTEYIEQHPDVCIRLINQENRGVSAARNHGIQEARAELIAFLDADDEWKPEYLETIMHLHEICPKAGIFSTAYNIQKGDEITPIICAGAVPGFEGYIPSYYYAISTGPQPINTDTIVIPAKILKELGGFNETMRIGEDLDLWARVALHYPVAYCAKPLCTYLIGTETSHIHTAKNDTGNKDNIPFVEYYKSVQDKNIPVYESKDNIDLYISYLYVLQAQKYAFSGMKKEAKASLKKATNRKIFMKKMGCLLYITLPEKWFKRLLKITGKFTNVGQTL